MVPRLALAAALLLAATPLVAGCAAGSPAASAPRIVVDDAAVNQARHQCLLDKGFAVTRGADGSTQFADPEDRQFPAYNEALRACEQELAGSGLLPPVTADTLRREYRLLSAAHACLTRRGFPLQPWPAEEVFLDRAGQANLLEATVAVDPDDALRACPAEFAALAEA